MLSIEIPRATEKVLRDRLTIPDGVSIVCAYEYEDDIAPDDTLWGSDDVTIVQWVHEQLKRGNEAAWFRCRVTVTDGDATGEDHLGACSYNTFEDFLTLDDYFGDMVASAYGAFMADAKRLAIKYAKVG